MTRPSFTQTPHQGLLYPDENQTDAIRDDGDVDAETLQGSSGAYFWLLLFFVVYCARPEDWVPGLSIIPLAKIAGVFCALSFVMSIPRLRYHLRRETIYLGLLIFQLWLTVPFSPVWRGGAFDTTLDFSKVLLIILVMGVAVTTMARLRQLIFVQTASVVVIGIVSLIREMVQGRLAGAVHGIYENSNELALILVLTLPFCIAFLLRARGWWRKVFWGTAAMLMVYATMLTGSRAGALALLVSGAVCLREFGIRGKRLGLLIVAVSVALAIMLAAGDTVKDRFNDMFGDEPTTDAGRAAYGSSLKRQELFWKSLAVTAEHPIFGVGPGNFNSISGLWHDQHNTYTQMSSEGGVPAFVLYALLLWCALANLRKINLLAPADSEEVLFAMALRASLWGFLVGSFFTASAYQFFTYFLVGYSSGLVAIIEAKYETVGRTEVQEEITGEYDETTAVFLAS